MFLAGLLIGILLGFVLTISRISWKLVYMYKTDPEMFEAFIDKIRSRLKEAFRYERMQN